MSESNNIVRVNFKSDIAFEEHIIGLDGQGIDPLSLDWEIVYRTSGSRRFVASNDGGSLTNAIIDENSGEMVVVFARHGLPQGRLIKELHVELDNEIFPEGIQNNYVPQVTQFELWDGPTDYSAAAPSELLLSYVKGDKGDPGIDAVVSGAEAMTLPAGSKATVRNAGASQNAFFVFGIPAGHDGKSAYQYARESGFSESEEEFSRILADAVTKTDMEKVLGDIEQALEIINSEYDED